MADFKKIPGRSGYRLKPRMPKAPASSPTLPSVRARWGFVLLLPRDYGLPNSADLISLRDTPYFAGEVRTCGTPEGDQAIWTLTPASLPAERMTALMRALSVLAFLSLGFTANDDKRSVLPALRAVRAFTSSAGALDFRPRWLNSASPSGISSKKKSSDIVSPLRN